MKMYRQGDLLFVKNNKLQFRGKTLLKERIIRGSSVTGHTHKTDRDALYTNKKGEYFISAPKGCNIIHEEHKTLSLPIGKYNIIIQKEVTGYVED